MAAQALTENLWITDMVGVLSAEACNQVVRLWTEIRTIQRDRLEPDRFRWKGAACGMYSAKETYKMLCQGRIGFSMHKAIWKSYAPLKCKIYCWLAVKDRHWTSDRRFRHGLQDHPIECLLHMSTRGTYHRSHLSPMCVC
jgi:hypothetical protein